MREPAKEPEIRMVEFLGEIYKVQSLTNGNYRLTIELPEYCVAQAKELMGWNRLLVEGWLRLKDGQD